ncbi:GNAT family N-acetyltransferase [Pedobacter polaris]|uniref:GNAT family N-acetyltransferase n=1 Tax=Pedobacter polaris TaxID=2571273 RepID=A0A4U1CW25_9SPHI|nr:GNAT family N-acetyltransferase [Pedobacter polaris]TKC13164.1 GNAT family N-acetyltransferase [Pedobacter polaris]
MNESLEIINSTTADVETIFEFYDMAIAHQKKVFNKHWQGFSLDLVKQEITENRQYKILVDGKVASIFAVTFNDPQIWKERDQDSAIYIHRIVTHPDFRGYGFVNIIIDWAIAYSKVNNIQYVRMDTWADNEKLLAYYTGCGFTHVGSIKIAPNSGLPKHYEGISLNLFEIEAK